MSSRKAYVEKVTNVLNERTRALLTTSGLSPKIIGMIQGRRDIFSKLAYFMMLTKNYAKGARGFVKADNFAMYGYINFNYFNKQARTDLEEFKNGLPKGKTEEENAKSDFGKFTEEENVIVIMCMPDDQSNLNLGTSVATGRSAFITFDKAVRTEYKVPGCFYLMIAFGDSFIKPAEEKKASVKATAFGAKMEKRKPSVIKGEFKEKLKTRSALQEAAIANAAQNDVQVPQSVNEPSTDLTSKLDELFSLL